ncbi:MAG: hypothetical protein WC114_09955 [Smithellaceae bacterium]
MSDKIITHPQSETYRRGYDAIDWMDHDSMDAQHTQDMPDTPNPEDADAHPA